LGDGTGVAGTTTLRIGAPDRCHQSQRRPGVTELAGVGATDDLQTDRAPLAMPVPPIPVATTGALTRS
jgi:hypothetical protein